MGFMDNFTSDSPVTVKQPDYYEMVKEAAKAELITNAVNAEVPGYYIQAMITGKKPDFLNTLDAEEEETGFRTEYIVFVNVVFLYIGRNRIGKVGFTWL